MEELGNNWRGNSALSKSMMDISIHSAMSEKNMVRINTLLFLDALASFAEDEYRTVP